MNICDIPELIIGDSFILEFDYSSFLPSGDMLVGLPIVSVGGNPPLASVSNVMVTTDGLSVTMLVSGIGAGEENISVKSTSVFGIEKTESQDIFIE